jgi:hypothetical protein
MLMSYRTVLHVSVRVKHHDAILFRTIKKVPDGLCTPKHTALCEMPSKCAGRHIAFVSDTGKHNGMHENKIDNH